MSFPFPFIPRKVARSAKVQGSEKEVNSHLGTSASPQGTSSSLTRLPVSPDVRDADTKSKGKGKAESKGPETGRKFLADEDYAMLVSLSLSDHALWSDPDLRRTLEWNSKRSGECVGREGFTPLSFLLRHSPVIFSLRLENIEAHIAKALRTCASDTLEVRMLVSEPSRSNWFGNGETSRDETGGYEIRRKDWERVLEGAPPRDFSKDDWAKRTIYLENIPPQYRTIPGIAQFVLSLLVNEALEYSSNRIQNITLPSHHQDTSEDLPKCKGFALVILAHTSDVEYLLQNWPWDRDHSGYKDTSTRIHEARKFGFRTLLKSRWEELNQEYLAYRERLMDEIVASQDATHISDPSSLTESYKHESEAPPSFEYLLPKTTVPMMDLSSPYPLNCLVYMRNIHPETNKTTLRSLCSVAFKDAIPNNQVQGDGIDYVDFKKGLDFCHLRLATPTHTQILVDYYTLNPVAQTRGLDDSGTPTTPDGLLPLSMEIVQGQQEELYWEKVPEKVRRLAKKRRFYLTRQAGLRAFACTPIPTGHTKRIPKGRPSLSLSDKT